MKTAVTLAARAHDKTPTHSYRSPPARTPAHAILPLLPLSVLSSLKPDTIKPISQDAVYRALTMYSGDIVRWKGTCSTIASASKRTRKGFTERNSEKNRCMPSWTKSEIC
jgi:uncharacterized protein YijF (DUF1287 family)